MRHSSSLLSRSCLPRYKTQGFQVLWGTVQHRKSENT
uniref:Uncharacterized protein n=1 Tax=Anguilla anguilla TaxID=7936 RepID=A0A0E9V2L4_ANGAN